MHPGTVLGKASPCVSVCRPHPPGPLVGQAGGRRRCVCVLAFTRVCSPQFPALADIYTEHAHQVVVAKYAPSGFYIASGGTVCTGLGWGGCQGKGVGCGGSGMAGGTTVLSFVWGRQEKV